MTLPDRMKFGIFLAPFHVLGENPTLGLERDLELVQWLDYLDFDEAWIGEHHTAGWETIASPEVFMGVAAERTKHIKLGTGVISLPYHHPLMVANRMTLLDHLTRGRVMLGVGPGALTTDAYMLGIDPLTQRNRMGESFDIIMRLLTETEPITYESDWFTLNEARLHLQPYTRPHFPVAVAAAMSPSGMELAGRHGAWVLSIADPTRHETARCTKPQRLLGNRRGDGGTSRQADGPQRVEARHSRIPSRDEEGGGGAGAGRFRELPTALFRDRDGPRASLRRPGGGDHRRGHRVGGVGSSARPTT